LRYIFSDGYADQFVAKKARNYGGELTTHLAEITDKPMQEQYEHLYNVFANWRGSYEQIVTFWLLV